VPLLPFDALRFGLWFLGGAVFVALVAPRERRHVLRLVLLAALALAVRGGAWLVSDGGSIARVLDVAGQLVAAIAVVVLAGSAVFGVLLPLVRVRAPLILRELVLAAGCIASFLLVLSFNRVEVLGLVATSAVLTAVIGWALQDTLGNVMGGLALQLDRSVEEGDWVTYGEVTGIVREVGWRQTSLETHNGDRLVVPNSVFMKSAVLLRGKRPGLPPLERRWVHVNVDSHTPPTAVIATIEAALRREAIPNVDQTSPPDCVLVDFLESGARYAARYWLTDMLRTDRTDTAVRTRIWFALRREGIALSIPSHSVLLTSDEEHRERARADDMVRKKSALARVSVLAPLNEEEHRDLAAHLVHAPFAAGESIVVQGSDVHHLYILTKGKVEVRVSVEGGPSRAVALLEAPDFFGEMGLLTGEPRKATVAAVTDVEAWRVEKEAIHSILAARPAVADAISRLVAERDVELAAVREGLSEEAKRLRLENEQGSVLAKIRAFFGIE
jgi:small-conductance mechanosensitive channel/CRP-like cAMP-binding protein